MAFLEKNELYDAYQESQNWARDFQAPFDEFERLSANKVRKNIQSNFPKINDGTLSSQLPEMAMRRFSQLFTGRFSVPGSPSWFVELVNILWTDVIVPGAKTDASFFTKIWNMFWDSEKYGAAGAFLFFDTRLDYTGASFKKMYIRDIKPEAGKISPQGCNYLFGDFYFTKLDMKGIIEAAGKEDAAAKLEKRESYNKWDVKLLQEYLAAGPEGKDSGDQNQTERDRVQHQYAPYKMSVAFHKGYKAPFYTFIPALQGKCVRRRENENPAGDIPIKMMYAIQNLENFYGRGVVEQAAGSQNLLDLYTQSDALATQIGMEPPLEISGDTNRLQEKTLIFGPRRKWRVGDAKVRVVNTNGDVYSQIDTRIGRAKGNVLNQLGSFDTTISSSAGDPQFSRTPAGVHALGSRTSDTDGFYINAGREFFGDFAETLMNIHLANMKGTEAQDISDDQAEMLEKAGWSVGDKRKVSVDYDKMEEVKTKFEVDPPANAHDPEKDSLMEGIKLVLENETALAQIRQSGYDLKVGELLVRYFRKLNIDRLDKIIVPINPGTTTGNAGDEDAETLQMEHQETMQQYGLNEQEAEAVMAARREGWSEEQIAEEIANARGTVTS